MNSAPEYDRLSRVKTNDDGFKKFGIMLFIKKNPPIKGDFTVYI